MGQLWLAYAAGKDEVLGQHARRFARRLLPRSTSDTVFRGFLFYYGAALGDILCGDAEAAELALAGARGLASAYNPAARLIPLGTSAEEASDVGNGEANIDGVPGGALLVWAAERTGDERLRRIAAAHAERYIELSVREDGSVVQSASFDPASGRVLRRYTHKGFSDTSTWARAQAWAMVGFALCTAWLGERGPLLDAAQRTAEWWMAHVPDDKVAFWDFDAPIDSNTPRDTSATAIATAALLKLAALYPERQGATRYRQFAEETVARLCAGYLTTGRDGQPPGILTCGCYNHRLGLATANELVWGDYYLYEALHVLTGQLEATRL